MSIAGNPSQSSLTPSNRRPIPLQVRPDLRIERIEYQGVAYWVVKEPVGLKYYRLQTEQHEVLFLLNGERSLEEIRDELLRILPTVRLQMSDIQHLITDLHQKGLVHSNRAGQGAALLKQKKDNAKKKVLADAQKPLVLAASWLGSGTDPDVSRSDRRLVVQTDRFDPDDAVCDLIMDCAGDSLPRFHRANS